MEHNVAFFGDLERKRRLICDAGIFMPVGDGDDINNIFKNLIRSVVIKIWCVILKTFQNNTKKEV